MSLSSSSRALAAVLLAVVACAHPSAPNEPLASAPRPGASVASVGGVPSSSAAVVASAASVELPAPPPAPRHLDVHLVPLGDVSADTLADTADALRAHAPVDVVIESRRPLPASASVGANRFRAEKLLEFLASLPLSLQTGGAKVMGVAAVDIVTTKGGNPTWGILGLGAIDGRCSVLSTFRIERAWEKGGGASAALVHARLWKVSLHELGHTLGLPHCPRARCIMEDAHGTVQTVDGEDALCPECAARFEAAIASGAALGAPTPD